MLRPATKALRRAQRLSASAKPFGAVITERPSSPIRTRTLRLRGGSRRRHEFKRSILSQVARTHADVKSQSDEREPGAISHT